MACPIVPADCIKDGIGNIVGGLANSAFEQVVKAFVTAANTLLESFAKAFASMEGPDLGSAGVKNIYYTSLGIAALVACLLLIGQIIRTVVTHDGSGMAAGLVGLGKAALAIMLTLTVSSAALKASDELTDFIIKRTFGSTKALTNKIAGVINWTNGQQVTGAAALLLLLAVIGILLTLVLWFELLLRNAAVVVLIATSPIAAAGQVNEGTRQWWTKAATATAQLIVLKPVIALVFALGFGMTGESKDLQGLLSGMLILLLAVFAWPAVARFFSFASVAVGGATGLGALLGFAAGQASKGGSPVGVSPDEFSQATEGRTMANFAGEAGGFSPGAARGAKGGAAASGAGAGGAAAGAGIAGVAVMALQAGQKAINSIAGGMDSMASHGGMHGRSAHYAAGVPVYADRYRHNGSGGYRDRDGNAHGPGEPSTDPGTLQQAPPADPVAEPEAPPAPSPQVPAPPQQASPEPPPAPGPSDSND